MLHPRLMPLVAGSSPHLLWFDSSLCSECGRKPREDEIADDEWRAGSDGVGELHIFCPECWEREFGES